MVVVGWGREGEVFRRGKLIRINPTREGGEGLGGWGGGWGGVGGGGG